MTLRGFGGFSAFLVSIHTPTKGVTHVLLALHDVSRVSIHTPTKGVTALPCPSQHRADGFNPHTHEGCDCFSLIAGFKAASFNPHTHEGCDGYAQALKASAGVSIHTPTKGVTASSLSITTRTSFNPHTHEGCDCSIEFIFKAWQCFNPHTHEGCDASLHLQLHLRTVSIHTPTKGVTGETR